MNPTFDEKEWWRSIEEELRDRQPIPNESLYHYKKYGVFKVITNPVSCHQQERKIAFNVPKHEAEIIIRSQKTKSVYEDGEITYLQSYKLQEEIQ